jgi:hypothetical protein
MLVYAGIAGSEMGGERGDLFLRSTRHKRGLKCLMENCSRGETSVGMYKLKEAKEKFYSDILASHRRKCDCALAGLATWRFFSHRKVIESLLMDTGYRHLQSINYHDSRALGYERFGVLTGLVDLRWFGLVMSRWKTAVGNCDWVVNL